MVGGVPSALGIQRPNELCVTAHFLHHARMLSTNRTVDHRCPRSLSHRPRRANCHRAVDDRQSGLEKLDIACSLANKILDLEGVADMQNVGIPDPLRWRSEERRVGKES